MEDEFKIKTHNYQFSKETIKGNKTLNPKRTLAIKKQMILFLKAYAQLIRNWLIAIQRQNEKNGINIK